MKKNGLTEQNLQEQNMKKLMILGAGIFQVSGIKKAVDLGYEVISVDYKPDNPGHRFSHKYINCSTVDKEGALKAARNHNIDGICTFSSDIAVSTAGYVSRSLGLPGIDPVVALNMSNKDLFRKFQRNNGLPHPEFLSIQNKAELLSVKETLSYPIVIKPSDTSGSRGVTFLGAENEIGLENAFEAAKKHSRKGVVVAEEFIEGTEVGGDGFMYEGRLVFFMITQKYLDGFVVTGHRVPVDLDKSIEEKIQKQLETCCLKSNYLNGSFNFDIMISGKDIFILEISPRTGGNGIPLIIEKYTGIDVEKMTILHAVNDFKPIEKQKTNSKGCGSLVFGSLKAGKLENIISETELKEKASEVISMFVAVKIGDKIESFTHNGNLAGFVLYDCANDAEYNCIKDKVQKNLNMKVV